MRSLLIITSILLAMIYTFPTLGLLFGFALVAYHKYVAAFFVIVCAWNISKLGIILISKENHEDL